MAPKIAADKMQRWIFAAGLAGMSGVALGAFGAHGLKGILDASETILWSKAVFYHLTHAVALLVVAMCAMISDGSAWRATLWGFLLGILLFSGSLYLMALAGWRWLAWLTPVGGMLLLWGWFGLILRSFNRGA